MISKIRKYQNSWLTKAILALTALSFMSLFGISGYVSSAGKNRAVIKVDNMEILQDEMNVKLQENIRKTQNMFGDAVTVDDEMRKDILAGLVKQNLTDMIIAREAQKENVSISDELIQQIISSQPEFMDASGRFSSELLRRQLSYFDMSEQEYINDLRQSILSRHLVSSPVEGIIFPQFMNRYVTRIENQQKIFDYISVNPADLKIDRDISDEEIEQYYEDFAPQFEEAEKRDVSFIELKIADLTRNITPSDDEIKAFYQDNIADYVIPEKREVLQMVFDNETDAEAAYKLLQSGNDFYQVAADKAGQDKETTALGEVTADSLLPELATEVFDAKLNDVVGPLNSEFGWHILKVIAVTPKKETSLASVKDKIISLLRQERAYDEALEIMTVIEDKIGAGADLKTIAKEYDAKILSVKGLKEDGSYTSLNNKTYADLVTSADFLDTAFSYNENEVSQTIETENGFVLAAVDKIEDARLKNIDEVKPEIIKIWTENEKSAIAQEIVNDVVADLDSGENLADIAKRFNLHLKTTPPLKKGETFAKLNSAQAVEAFQTATGGYAVLSSGGITTIVSPLRVINHDTEDNPQQLEAANTHMRKDLEQNAAAALINAYARTMDVRVKYRLLGLEN